MIFSTVLFPRPAAPVALPGAAAPARSPALSRTRASLSGIAPSRCLLALSLLVSLAGAAGQAGAQGVFENMATNSSFREDFDDSEKTWKELSVQLPPPPSTATLAEIYVSPIATQTFFVDTGSLSIGVDGVVRYVSLAVSEHGARNVGYEGIRCETGEQKLYASGRSDGSWARSRNDSWQRIRGGNNGLQDILARSFFCNGEMVGGKVADLNQKLRAGSRPRPTPGQ